MALAPGTRLGPYEVTAKLGEGGMGVVWRAKDSRLGREVALKVLPEELAADPERLDRFEREARLLARLNHPNIAQIHGLEVGDDTRAIVMELVEGPTLAQRLSEGALPLAEFFSLARQIAEALAEAHDNGIVHRDLKPQNIKLAPGGKVKVLDFGLAKQETAGALGHAPGEESTTLSGASRAGVVLGTVGYMAPEQVRGEIVDARADIFSFGCILQEMLTGQRAFARPTPIETMTAILHDAPPAPSRARRDVPPGLDGLVAHCLEKDAASRFRSARDLAFALAALSSAGPAAPERPRAASVAVLPFVNLSADPENEFFADGITEDVIAHLAKVRSLKVISRTSVMTFKKRDRSLREIGEKLGASTLLEGSVRRAGNRVRIVAQLIDGATDEHLWAETYDRDLTDIFAIQTDVALQIASALRAELSSDERARVRRQPTADLEAYELYLRGRNSFYRFSAEGFRRSLVNYELAVARDPLFALAWAGIAQVHAESCVQGTVGSSPEEAVRRAKEAAARALELDDELAEAHGIAGMIRFAFDFDWAGGERELLKAIELSPGSADVHDHYGWLLSARERFDDALREVRRARELDPLLIQSDVATTLLRAGRTEEALEEARRAVALEPGSTRCQTNLGWALILLGETAEGIAAMERALALSPDDTIFLAQLGQAYAVTGEVGRARRILDQLHERAKREFISPYHFAYVHTGLGEADAAVDWLERAFERRSGAIYGIKGSFLFRSLRKHPRFEALLRQMNLA
ncbi:MAG TPA: protein kinase [Thermoanaerobaculia bacterium]|nr:protein kinase [Thermoanaerobaculia bacterium]